MDFPSAPLAVQTPHLARTLGVFERLMHVYSVAYPTHVCEVVELEGRRSREEIRRAFDAVVRRHPILATFIGTHEGAGPALFQTPHEMAMCFMVPVRFMARREAEDWRAVVAQELATPFDTSRPPLLRAVVIEGDGDMTIILTVDHAVSDGMSLVFIVNDLLDALSGKVLAEGEVLAPMEELALDCLPPADPLTVTDDAASAPAPDDSPMPRPNWWDPKAPVTVETVVLDDGATARLIARCRAERATVHGALCAALAAALSELTGRPAHAIYSPLDTRRLMSSDTRTSNMMFGSFLARIEASPDFWETARTSVAGIEAARSLEGFVAMTRFLAAALPPEAPAEACRTALAAAIGEHMISNVGVLDLAAQYGDLRVKACWGPACTTHIDGYQFLGVSTHGGRLRIINTTGQPVPGLLETTARHLSEACA